MSLQIRTTINRIMKNELPYCNIQFVFRTKCKISKYYFFKILKNNFLKILFFKISLHLKKKYHCSYVLALFTNFSVAAAMLPIMPKLSIILISECVNTWEFLHSLGNKLQVTMILPLNNILFSAITHLILKISQFLLATTATLKLH